jgi:glycoprotein endo-alpha-1,2-mannosidase
VCVRLFLIQSFSGVRFQPPHDFGASFAPRDGLYSSADPQALDRQFAQMAVAGVTAAAISWWGRPDVSTAHDGEGVRTDDLVPLVLRAAEQHGVKVIFHLEPYEVGWQDIHFEG